MSTNQTPCIQSYKSTGSILIQTTVSSNHLTSDQLLRGIRHLAVEVLLVIPWLLAAMFTSQVGQLLFKFSLKTKTILYCLIRLLNIYVLCTTFIFEVITSYNCLSLPWLKHSTSGIPSLYFYVTYLVLTGFPPETSLHGFLLVL